MPSQFHIIAFVNFKLGEQNFSLLLVDELLQHRRNHQTGRAPLGPHIHQHRVRVRGLEYALLKILQTDIKNRRVDCLHF